MWQELGIAPTADMKEIHRAYARRLKSIDADRDPAAFQRLRQALEAALATVDRGGGRREGSPVRSSGLGAVPMPRERPVPDPGVAQPARRPVVTDLAAVDLAADAAASRALRQDFSRALATGDVAGAFARLTTGIARGLVALADQQDMIATLMVAAVDDRRLPGESFIGMARQFGWGKPLIGDEDGAVREKVAARLDAEAWFASFAEAVLARGRWPSCADREARALARGVLGSGPAWPLLLIHSGMIHWFFAAYDRFAPWVSDRFDARRGSAGASSNVADVALLIVLRPSHCGAFAHLPLSPAMFDLAWSHLLLIGAVALIVIGPKELPGVLRTLGQWMARARAIAREFQGSLDQMIRESELEEVRKEVEKTASLDIRKEIENTIDPGAEMQRALSEPPIADQTVTPAVTPPPEVPALAEAEAAASPHEPAPAGTEPPTPPGMKP